MLHALRGEQVAEPLADDLVPAVAESVQPRLVHLKEAPGLIQRLIADGRSLKEQPKTLFALFQKGLGTPQVGIRLLKFRYPRAERLQLSDKIILDRGGVGYGSPRR